MKIAVHLRHPDVPCWNWTAKQTSILQESLPRAIVHACDSTDAFLHRLRAADVAVVWRFRQDWFADASRLRLLATPAAGRDYFGVVPPTDVDVAYGTFHGRIMAETVVGALLGMSRGLLPAATQFSTLSWPLGELAKRMRPLRGSSVTILGFGHIGAEIAALLQGFDVIVTGLRRTPPGTDNPPDSVGLTILPVAELGSVLKRTDHLILALPGTPETDQIINAEALALLPPHATLINVGRGNAVDETALIQCLRNGTLFGAFLDVFEQEPIPADSPLRQCPNLWMLPHASAISPNYMDLYAEELARTIPLYLSRKGK